MFPALPWSWLTFFQYGKGGAAPAVDRADQYVYLTAGEYLARIPRENLANLNKADFQYYRGAPLDGMLDSSWSSATAGAGKVLFTGPKVRLLERRLQLRPEALCRDRGPVYKAAETSELA